MIANTEGTYSRGFTSSGLHKITDQMVAFTRLKIEFNDSKPPTNTKTLHSIEKVSSVILTKTETDVEKLLVTHKVRLFPTFSNNSRVCCSSCVIIKQYARDSSNIDRRFFWSWKKVVTNKIILMYSQAQQKKQLLRIVKALTMMLASKYDLLQKQIPSLYLLHLIL